LGAERAHVMSCRGIGPRPDVHVGSAEEQKAAADARRIPSEVERGWRQPRIDSVAAGRR
jgi:hypothetical protein